MKKLVVSDLSAIEMVVLAWWSQDRELLRIVHGGLDPYKAFAEAWLGLIYDLVWKEIRDLCKPPMLGCGYGLGGSGLVAYADRMGITMDEDTALEAVATYRSTYAGVPKLWKDVENSVRAALYSPGKVFGQHLRIEVKVESRFLTIRLPSGRKLYYDKPELEDGDITYMGQNQYTGKWERLRTYGAKLVENVVQAIAAELLTRALFLYDQAGGTIVGHVHDEIIAEEDADQGETWLETMNECFRSVPGWGEDLVLDAKGYIAERYRKD